MTNKSKALMKNAAKTGDIFFLESFHCMRCVNSESCAKMMYDVVLL